MKKNEIIQLVILVIGVTIALIIGTMPDYVLMFMVSGIILLCGILYLPFWVLWWCWDYDQYHSNFVKISYNGKEYYMLKSTDTNIKNANRWNLIVSNINIEPFKNAIDKSKNSKVKLESSIICDEYSDTVNTVYEEMKRRHK
jgi:hypothetical protein